METLLALDRSLFFFINGLYHSPLTHAIALMLSGVGLGAFLWIGIGLVLFFKEEQRDHRFFIPIGVALGLSWLVSEIILKHVFARARPFIDMMSGVTVIGGEAPGYSFPSSHATTAFAMATVLSSYEPRLKWAFYLLAVFVSISRVYMGVHYPSDVIVGGCIGSLIGVLVVRVYPSRKIEPELRNSGHRRRT